MHWPGRDLRRNTVMFDIPRLLEEQRKAARIREKSSVCSGRGPFVLVISNGRNSCGVLACWMWSPLCGSCANTCPTLIFPLPFEADLASRVSKLACYLLGFPNVKGTSVHLPGGFQLLPLSLACAPTSRNGRLKPVVSSLCCVKMEDSRNACCRLTFALQVTTNSLCLRAEYE